MESLASIQKAIDYIEENLKNDISIGQVAAAIGYSEYHFLRIFKRFVGFTPASYIRKRRISEIVGAMERNDSSRPISDIAFECGFNSKERVCISGFFLKISPEIWDKKFKMHTRNGCSAIFLSRFDCIKGCPRICLKGQGK